MTDNVSEMEQHIREKLQASGELVKMRAMIVEAALRTLKSSSNSSSSKDINLSTARESSFVYESESEALQGAHVPSSKGSVASSIFLPHPSLLSAKKKAQDQLILAAVMDYLHSLGLQFTANMLRMEANLQDVHLPSADDLANALHVTEIVKGVANNTITSQGESTILSAVIARAVGSAEDVVIHVPLHNSSIAPTFSANRATTATAAPVIQSPADESESAGTIAAAATATTTISTDKTPTRTSEVLDAYRTESHAEQVSDVARGSTSNGSATSDASAAVTAEGEDTTYFISRWNDMFFVRGDDIEGQQLQVEYLTNCTVSVLSAIDSMTVDDCNGGEVVIAACEGSVFLRNCRDMLVHVACKQLRLRDCANMDIRLFTSTDPVIEMSHHIDFRPFHLRLPHLERSFTQARLNASINRFVHVYDFTKTVATLPQPHFTLHYPNHSLTMESRVPVGRNHKPDEHYNSAPECPHEIEDLLMGRLRPAASSETGENKSYDIATGAAVWAADASAEHTSDNENMSGSDDNSESGTEEDSDEADEEAEEDTDSEEDSDEDENTDEDENDSEEDDDENDTDEEQNTDDSRSGQVTQKTVMQPPRANSSAVRTAAEQSSHPSPTFLSHAPPSNDNRVRSHHGHSAVALSAVNPKVAAPSGIPPSGRSDVARTSAAAIVNEDAYSSFDDTGSENEEKDEYSVDEDDDVF